MKQLFAPWRASGVEKTKKDRDTGDKSCPFCTQFAEQDDQKNLLIRRFNHTFIMMNKYPYNAGHLLILPIRHVQNITSLSKEERIEIMELGSISTEILTRCLKCDGLNIGINIGKASGASIPTHIHMHVLPRWNNDTNFMPVLADTKIISFDMGQIYGQLRQEFEAIKL